jgi:hypothetical protein
MSLCVYCVSVRAGRQTLEERGISSYLEVIDKARVPIVKLKDRVSGLAFDICFDVPSGPVSSQYVCGCVSLHVNATFANTCATVRLSQPGFRCLGMLLLMPASQGHKLCLSRTLWVFFFVS